MIPGIGYNNNISKLTRGCVLVNKADLVNDLSKKVNLSKKDATDVVDTFCDSITKALKKGDKVTIMGFGSFEVRKRAARTGRNPQTGKPISIKAKKVPKFNPGKELKDAIK